MSNRPSILYSLIGEEPICGHSNVVDDLLLLDSMNVLVASISLRMLGYRVAKEER